MARQTHLAHLVAVGTITLLTLLVVSRSGGEGASELEDRGPPLSLSLPAAAMPRHAGHLAFSPQRGHTRGRGREKASESVPPALPAHTLRPPEVHLCPPPPPRRETLKPNREGRGWWPTKGLSRVFSASFLVPLPRFCQHLARSAQFPPHELGKLTVELPAKAPAWFGVGRGGRGTQL